MLEVELAGVGSVVRGAGAHELVREVTRRPPVWVPLARGFSVQEHTARDVIAAAELRLYDIVVTGPRVVSATPVQNRTPEQSCSPDPGRGLW